MRAPCHSGGARSRGVAFPRATRDDVLGGRQVLYGEADSRRLLLQTEGVVTMNDREIRDAYHRRRLSRQHKDPDTRVVDELGLRHGVCRADIAVVNGHLVGIEIKSDVDSLDRLSTQVASYSSVFDRAILVSTDKHLPRATDHVPEWWDIVCANQGPRGGIEFTTVRRGHANPCVDSYAVAQLLWRDEAVGILADLGVEDRELRGTRAVLYDHLVSRLPQRELRRCVRETIKRRAGWRDLAQPSSDVGLCPPGATS